MQLDVIRYISESYELWSLISSTEILALSSTCRRIHSVVASFISNNYTFSHGYQFVVYRPQKLKVYRLEDLKTLPPSLGHLEVELNQNLKLTSFPLPMLPSNLTFLSIQIPSTIPIPPGCLAATITSLNMLTVDQPLDNILPPQLQTLKLDVVQLFPYSFNCLASLPLIDLSLRCQQYELSITSLPNSLQRLSLEGAFTQPFSILPSLQQLTDFNIVMADISISCDKAERQRGEKGRMLSPHLKMLDFSDAYFDQPISNLFPTSLTSLSLPRNFNHPIDDLPDSITALNLGQSFNQPINKFPNSLTCLFLGNNFSHKLNQRCQPLISLTVVSEIFGDNISVYLPHTLKFLEINSTIKDGALDHLPPLLTKLSFPYSDYNHPIDNLPESLTDLNVCDSFDQLVDNLPKSLKSLQLGAWFNQEVDHLPPNLSELVLGDQFDMKLDNLPRSLLVLHCDNMVKKYIHPLDKLPDSLEILVMPPYFDIPLARLPRDLKILQVSHDYTHSLPPLPFSLQELTLRNSFDHNLSSLPPSLVAITIHADLFHQSLSSLPSSLASLSIFGRRRGRFNQPVDSLPNEKLTHVVLGDESYPLPLFNQSIDGLPDCIESLTLCSLSFDQPITKFPRCLRTLLLLLPPTYNHSLPPLPTSARNVTCRPPHVMLLSEEYDMTERSSRHWTDRQIRSFNG